MRQGLQPKVLGDEKHESDYETALILKVVDREGSRARDKKARTYPFVQVIV